LKIDVGSDVLLQCMMDKKYNKEISNCYNQEL